MAESMPPSLPASRRRRAIAFILDTGFAINLAALGYIGYLAAKGPDSDSDLLTGVVLLCVLPAIMAILLASIPRSGAGPGKRLLGLRLEGSPAGSPVPFAHRLVRAGMMSVLGPILGLIASVSPARRHFADTFSRTRVGEASESLRPDWSVRAIGAALFLITLAWPLSLAYREALLQMPAVQVAIAQFRKRHPEHPVQNRPLWARLRGDRAEVGLISPRGLEVVRLDRPALDWRLSESHSGAEEIARLRAQARIPAAVPLPNPAPSPSSSASPQATPSPAPSLLESVTEFQGDPLAFRETANRLEAATQVDLRDPTPRLLRVELLARAAGFVGSPEAFLAEAETDLQIARDLAPQRYETHIAAAYLYLARDDRRQMRRETSAAAEVRPDGAEHRLFEALLENLDGYPERAIPRLEAVLNGPAKTDAMLALKVRRILAPTYLAAKRPADAEREYQSLLASERQPVFLYTRYSTFLVAEKRYDEAVTYAEKAQQAFDAAYTRTALSSALQAKARGLLTAPAHYEEAIGLFQKAVEQDALNVSAYFGAGEAFAAKFSYGKSDEARDRAEHYFKSVLKLQPDHGEARKALEKIRAIAGVHPGSP